MKSSVSLGSERRSHYSFVAQLKLIMLDPNQAWCEFRSEGGPSEDSFWMVLKLASLPACARLAWNLSAGSGVINAAGWFMQHLVVHCVSMLGLAVILSFLAKRNQLSLSSANAVLLACFVFSPYALSNLLYPALWFSLVPLLLSLYGAQILLSVTDISWFEYLFDSPRHQRVAVFGFCAAVFIVTASLSSVGVVGSFYSASESSNTATNSRHEQIRNDILRAKSNSEHATSMAIIGNMQPSGETVYNGASGEYEWQPY